MKPNRLPRSRAALAIAAVVGAVASLAGCADPPDGVQSIAFVLGPPPVNEARFLPPASELRGADPAVLAQAAGRCDVDIAAGRSRCTFTGLPSIEPTDSGQLRAWELRFIMGPYPTLPRTNAANVERSGEADPEHPDAPRSELLPRANLGTFAADPLGRATGTFAPSMGDRPLDHTLGGELMLLVPQADGTRKRYLAIDGRVGNLPSDAGGGTGTTPPASGGGHNH